MKEMTLSTQQIIAIAEYAGLTVVNKTSVIENKTYILADLLDI